MDCKVTQIITITKNKRHGALEGRGSSLFIVNLYIKKGLQ